MSPRGTYALLLHLDAPRTVQVGALGALAFPAGWYLYVGSARGPGGLAARLARHRRQAGKRFHWHIDYVRAVTRLVQVWTRSGNGRQECDWATAAATLPGARVIAPRFGASDCRCPSHLFHFAGQPDPAAFASLIGGDLIRTRIDADGR
jgi:Uri superfamily endonuclease